MFTHVAPPMFRYPAPTLEDKIGFDAKTGKEFTYSEYKTHDGRRAKRASKVVGEPFEPHDWYEMCGGQKDGQAVSDIINKIGTLTHKRIELYLKNEKSPKWNLPYVNAYFGGIQPLLDNITNVMCNEQPVYSPTLGIAGTIDCIADYRDVTSIVDFKTSTKPKKESEIKPYFLQTTLYSRIFEEMTGLKIRQIAILMTVQGGQYKEFVKDIDGPIVKTGTMTCNQALDQVLTKFEGLRN